jgi:hypothetical protein
MTAPSYVVERPTKTYRGRLAFGESPAVISDAAQLPILAPSAHLSAVQDLLNMENMLAEIGNRINFQSDEMIWLKFKLKTCAYCYRSSGTFSS